MTEYEEIGKRALLCKHWRWLPGMRTNLGGIVVHAETEQYVEEGDNRIQGVSVFHGGFAEMLLAEAYPDLKDPATLGCVLELAREANESFVAVVPGDFSEVSWLILTSEDTHLMAEYDLPRTEAEAVVMALEYAGSDYDDR